MCFQGFYGVEGEEFAGFFIFFFQVKFNKRGKKIQSSCPSEGEQSITYVTCHTGRVTEWRACSAKIWFNLMWPERLRVQLTLGEFPGLAASEEFLCVLTGGSLGQLCKEQHTSAKCNWNQVDFVHLPLKTSKQRGDQCHTIGKGVHVRADEPLLAKKVVSLYSNV